MKIFRSERLDQGAPNISWDNSSMPFFPEGVSLYGRVMCLLGYHLPQERRTGPDHVMGNGNKCDFKLRDQCGRCGSLL